MERNAGTERRERMCGRTMLDISAGSLPMSPSCRSASKESVGKRGNEGNFDE